MREAATKALEALRFYLQRGQEVLDAIEAGDLDRLEETLRWRKAAFHNFRVYDVEAQSVGCDLATNLEARDLWVGIERIDGQIEAAYGKLADVVVAELGRMRMVRRKIGSFQSGHTPSAKITESV